jgi:hypothetical protein
VLCNKEVRCDIEEIRDSALCYEYLRELETELENFLEYQVPRCSWLKKNQETKISWDYMHFIM